MPVTVGTRIPPGTMLCDMHGTNLRSKRVIETRDGRRFETRNVVEWLLPDRDDSTCADAEAWPTLSSLPRIHMQWYFEHQCHHFGTYYINKMLITLAEENDMGWTPVGYIYDGRRVGFAEVKELIGSDQPVGYPKDAQK